MSEKSSDGCAPIFFGIVIGIPLAIMAAMLAFGVGGLVGWGQGTFYWLRNLRIQLKNNSSSPHA